MASSTITNPASIVVDACVVIAICAKESDKLVNAQTQIAKYAASGARFYAPGVIVGECLYVLCKKLEKGELTTIEHRDAIAALITFITAIDPPPTGDRTLVKRAEELRGGLSSNRSADGIYLALAEELAKAATTEVITFDSGMKSQATANFLAPQVVVLPLVSPTTPPPP